MLPAPTMVLVPISIFCSTTELTPKKLHSPIVTSPDIGTLFHHQTVDDVVKAVEIAEQTSFHPSKLARTAKRFDKGLFLTKIKKVVYDKYH